MAEYEHLEWKDKPLSLQVKDNRKEIDHLHTHLGRCPIKIDAIQFYADEMERNRKNFEDLQFKVVPMNDELKELGDKVNTLMDKQDETLMLTKELIKRFKDVVDTAR